MPTAGGKPQVGDWIRDRHGKVIGTVQQRTGGDPVYSVLVKWRGQAQPAWITEFAWWRDHNGWTVTAPGELRSSQIIDRDELVEVAARTLYERDEEERGHPLDGTTWVEAPGDIQQNYRADMGGVVDALLAHIGVTS